jgi:hypothetical protein
LRWKIQRQCVEEGQLLVVLEQLVGEPVLRCRIGGKLLLQAFLPLKLFGQHCVDQRAVCGLHWD